MLNIIMIIIKITKISPANNKIIFNKHNKIPKAMNNLIHPPEIKAIFKMRLKLRYLNRMIQKLLVIINNKIILNYMNR
jgi:hypothetical protein